jgi:nucleoside-diphosphate-sugar epimerase
MKERLDAALVTGATGFIASNLIKELASRGVPVLAATRDPSTPEADSLARLTGVTVVGLDDASLADTVADAGVKRVYHLAAPGVAASDRDPSALVDGCVTRTLSLLSAVHKAGIRRFVNVGTWSEYAAPSEPGRPIGEDQSLVSGHLYGAAKAAAFLMGQAYAASERIPYVNARLFNVYGPGEAGYRLLPQVCRKLRSGEPVALTPGTQQRDFMFVADAIEGLLCLAHGGDLAYPVYNVATGEPHSVREMVGIACAHIGADASLLEFGALEQRSDEPPCVIGNASRLHRELGWQVMTPFREGVQKTVDYHIGQIGSS